MSGKTVAAIELGGTSASVAITNELGNFLYKKKGINTAPPRDAAEAVKEIAEALKEPNIPFEAIGIASFGPIDIKNGKIANTPKPNWRQFPFISELRKYFGNDIPIIFETDVNAPAYSEYLALHKEDPSISSVAYLTIGTGVGLGAFLDDRMVHGRLHPEFGHTLIAPRKDDHFEGTCPFHGPCIEGLIATGALAKRLNISHEELVDVPVDDPIWDLFAYYVAETAAAAAYAYAIDVLVVGGGIMTGDNRGYLYDLANEHLKKIINGYIEPPVIRRPYYNKDAGLVGASACAFHSEVFKQ
ncbi:Fructokinase [Tritrichomonas foetus]|uniref:fructokinase n=1 Tax=Tritrichomonas foetus TaxID=1144522 RepID=A0A1J4KK96_9EUKA|nr:Fructokinase [Tritrichomonas foetus]|eukprot:OHT11651.1 Fructokinase [Tritrichomonas foetus]